ncbi:hypothetical protein [Amorphus coralli]|uniref:hypothetical protein n=1 Tax=Amorphus coralli TaxID=340680 RepID=UPI0003608F3B|nr:hypothetical protein [Amorphus coralli]
MTGWVQDGWRIPFGAPRLTGDGSSGVRSACLAEDAEPLRLSSGAVDVAPGVPAVPSAGDQFAALRDRLVGLSDPWSWSAQAFVEAYFAFVEDEIARSEDAIARQLVAHAGLYTPADLRFSAWLPLPQAHVPGMSGSVRFPFVFWSGAEIVAVEIGQGRATADAAALLPPARIMSVDATDLQRQPVATLRAALPDAAVHFWDGVAAPVAPLRTPDEKLAL